MRFRGEGVVFRGGRGAGRGGLLCWLFEGFSPSTRRNSPLIERFSPSNKGFSPLNERFSALNEGYSALNEGRSALNEGRSALNEGLSPPMGRLSEDAHSPGRKAKPQGVAFAEIRFQVGGTMPTDPNAMTPLAMEGRAPYRADFDTEDIGKTVYYVLRWVNSRGEAGPWSPFYSAVVPG